MSYMNDDTDPFGVPYTKASTCTCLKELKKEEKIIKYNLTEYKELLNQKEDFKKTLEHLNYEIDIAKRQIETRIKEICDGVVQKVIFKKDKITVVIHMISFSRLVQLKEELSLEEIEIRVRIGSNIFELDLIW